MAAPHKMCPQCKSPAPLEATFCGQCGRQYRTQFAPSGVAVSTVPPVEPGFPVDASMQGAPIPATSAPTGRGLSFAIVGMALVVAVLIVTIVHRGHPEMVGDSGRTHVTQASGAVAPPFPLTSSPKMPNLDSDPLTDAAKGVVERADCDLDMPPPASAVGADGRIHLRNGGSITREEWDAAAKKVNNSPINHVPIVPPVP